MINHQLMKCELTFLQVILEHLPFVDAPILACAFETHRVLVNGSPVQPSHTLSLGQTWEMVFHRHETEVRGHPYAVCMCENILFFVGNILLTAHMKCGLHVYIICKCRERLCISGAVVCNISVGIGHSSGDSTCG